jgi:hypothetical protein
MHAKPPPLPPAHLLLLLHQLPSDGSAGVSLKQLIDGVQACLAEKSVFTMQVVADALQLIVHLDPLPLIFMRTTIQALLYHPLLAQFIGNGEFGRGRLQNTQRLGHDFRPDPVPRQHRHLELVFLAHKSALQTIRGAAEGQGLAVGDAVWIF